MRTSNEEFFIGWQGKTPEQGAKYLRKVALAAFIAVAAIAIALAVFQQTIARAWFEFGNVRVFKGLLVASPVPMLLANERDETSGESVFLLVSPLKYGYPAELAKQFHLRPVTIRGTLIYNESGGAMIEAVETLSLEAPAGSTAPSLGTARESQVTLAGEIVDSKCWLGVMNPGTLKPHRACAINCIRGGIPPVLLVNRSDMYVLVGPNGEPVNDAVLKHVALPVSVAGTLVNYGTLCVFKIDPSAIQSAELR
jgi:hypothetical protein